MIVDMAAIYAHWTVIIIALGCFLTQQTALGVILTLVALFAFPILKLLRRAIS